MGALLQFNRNYEPIECCSCSMMFYVPANWEKNRRDKHDGFWCPNGHLLIFNAKSEAEKLREELAAEQRRLHAALSRENEQAQRAIKAEKQLKSHKKRAANGTCPCCKRTFVQLQRHMKIKHPNYVEEI